MYVPFVISFRPRETRVMRACEIAMEVALMLDVGLQFNVARVGGPTPNDCQVCGAAVQVLRDLEGQVLIGESGDRGVRRRAPQHAWNERQGLRGPPGGEGLGIAAEAALAVLKA